MNRRGRSIARLLVWAVLIPAGVRAGPPFLTDDPEPVETGHWEFYAASQWSWARDAASGTLPHFEVNFGAAPRLQVHAIVPAVLAWNRGQPLREGLGDLELGAKFRFLDEGGRRPQAGIFPLVTLPTGAQDRGLGAGAAQVTLPVWLQKSSGPWLAYGGGGVRLASGSHDAFAGGLIQRALSDKVALGTEVFVTIPGAGEPIQVQLDGGLVIDFTEQHHLLLSAGPSFGNAGRGQAYLGYLLTR